MHVMHCREIATLLNSDAAERLTWVDRAQLRVHLWTCWHCRLLVRQLRWMREVARQQVNTLAEADPGLENRIVDRLRSN